MTKNTIKRYEYFSLNILANPGRSQAKNIQRLEGTEAFSLLGIFRYNIVRYN
jgi:hypothetical protein